VTGPLHAAGEVHRRPRFDHHQRCPVDVVRLRVLAINTLVSETPEGQSCGSPSRKGVRSSGSRSPRLPWSRTPWSKVRAPRTASA